MAKNFNSKFSNVATATTLYSIPLTPSNLTGTGISTGQNQLSWIDNSFNETSFRIERKISGGAFSEIDNVAANIVTYNDNSIIPRTYTYRVRALNPRDYSDYSNEMVILGIPTGLTISQTGVNGQLRATWIPNSVEQTGFLLQKRVGTTGTFTNIGTSNSTGLSFTETTGLNGYITIYTGQPEAFEKISFQADGKTGYYLLDSGVSGFFYPQGPPAVFRTSNSGQTWSPIYSFSDSTWPQCIASSKDGRVVFIGTNSNVGFPNEDGYISTDTGNSFTAKNLTGVGDFMAISDCCMSYDGRIIMAAATHATNSKNIFISTDFGSNWDAKFTPRRWNSVACSSGGNIIFAAGTVLSDIWRSLDTGVTTNEVGTGNIVCCNPLGNIVYSANVGSIGKIARSNNTGNSWQILNVDFQREIRDISCSEDGSTVNCTFVNVSKIGFSTDSGNNWNELLLAADTSNICSFTPTGGGKVFAGFGQNSRSTFYSNDFNSLNLYYYQVKAISGGLSSAYTTGLQPIYI